MKNDDLLPVELLCTHYNIEVSFITSLTEFGLIEITKVEETNYCHVMHNMTYLCILVFQKDYDQIYDSFK